MKKYLKILFIVFSIISITPFITLLNAENNHKTDEKTKIKSIMDHTVSCNIIIDRSISSFNASFLA